MIIYILMFGCLCSMRQRSLLKEVRIFSPAKGFTPAHGPPRTPHKYSKKHLAIKASRTDSFHIKRKTAFVPKSLLYFQRYWKYPWSLSCFWVPRVPGEAPGVMNFPISGVPVLPPTPPEYSRPENYSSGGHNLHTLDT